jgi:hypothetical protein
MFVRWTNEYLRYSVVANFFVIRVDRNSVDNEDEILLIGILVCQWLLHVTRKYCICDSWFQYTILNMKTIDVKSIAMLGWKFCTTEHVAMNSSDDTNRILFHICIRSHHINTEIEYLKTYFAKNNWIIFNQRSNNDHHFCW